MTIAVTAKETLLGAGVTIATTAVCFAFFVAVQVLSYWIPPDRAAAHLRQAFVDGDLQLANSLPHDAVKGYHQRNDCLVFWMTIIRPEEIGEYLSAGQFVGDPSGRTTYCEVMRDHLLDDRLGTEDYGNYLRYLHGYRAVTVFALSVLDVPGMRLLYKGLCYALLLTSCLLALRRLAPGRGPSDEMAQLRASGGVALTVAFALFYGLPYFGQSPSHAPLAWTIFAFLIFATGRDLLAMGRVAYYAALSAFGAFVAFFEYLTGGAVIGLAMLLGLLALQGERHTAPGPYVRRSVLGVFAYLGGIVLAFLFNLALNFWHFGNDALIRFARALITRMGTTTVTRTDGVVDGGQAKISGLDVAEALVAKLDFLAGGNPVLAQLVFVACGFAIVGFAVVGLIHARSATSVVRVALVVASVAVVLLWYAAFKNHSLIHAAFMVRVLVWIPAAALLMAVLAFEHLWGERPAPAAPRRPLAARRRA